MDLATARQVHGSLVHVCAPPTTGTGGLPGGARTTPSFAPLFASLRFSSLSSLGIARAPLPWSNFQNDRGFRCACCRAAGAPVRRPAPIAVLQVQAEQCLALYISTEEQTLFDVLLAMRFQKRQFEERNILMVPILVSSDSCSLVELSPRLSGSKLLNQSYVAVPAPKNDEDREAWGQLLAREFSE
ncbi:unnamed protein product, partial [Prorocentrum cordatum]